MLRKNSEDPSIQTTYFIVLNPIYFKKKLDDDEAVSILNKVRLAFPVTNSIYIYTDKEQAKFSASQFAAREIPNMFNKNKHNLAKPILCLTLNYSLNLKDSGETIFFGAEGQKKLVSYKVSATELAQWEQSQWSVLVNENELIPSNYELYDNNAKQEHREKCILQ